jgi:TonB-linked SusC/RagA family outer membrane protein
MKKVLLLVFLFLTGIPFLYSQTKLITGTVKAAGQPDGPVSGATVRVKGTSAGTTTDSNGKYFLSVPEKADTLIFSYIGMKKQEVPISGRTVVDIEMELDILDLQEVIVAGGYEIKRVQRSTGALTQVVSGDKLNEVRQSDINSALAGKVTGIQFLGQSGARLDNTGYLRLRGGSGLGTGVSAVYVVDGTIIFNSSDINLDDIDNVSVLSGPAAAALLGAQGANGAIIITTRKAKMTGAKSMGVEVNSGFMASSVYILPHFQNEYAGGYNTGMKQYTYRESDPQEWQSLDGKYYHSYAATESWGPRMEGQEYIPWYAWYPGTKYTGKTANLIPQPDNVRDFYEIGTTFNNTIAFDQTGEKYNIHALIGNVAVNGNIPASSINKTNFAIRTSYDITKHLTFEANVNFVSSYTTGIFEDGWGSNTSKLLNEWSQRDLDMNLMKELRGLRSPVESLATWNHNDPEVYSPDNPLYFYGVVYKGNNSYNYYTFTDYQRKYNRSNRLFGDISLNYRIIDGLYLKVTYRRQENNSLSELKAYSDLFESSSRYSPGSPNGNYSTAANNSYRENIETLLSFSKRFGKVSVNANAGSDFFSSKALSNSISTMNGFNIRNLFAISNSKDQPLVINAGSAEKYRAIFLRGDVGFRNIIFGEFTLRNDWFSTLPPDNNAVLSKSLGASFVFSDLLKLPWLNFSRLRASWGEIPEAIGAYVYPGLSYEIGQYKWNGNFVMTTPDQIVDSEIHGNVKRQTEAGLELRFLKNRAGISATYWEGTERDIPCNVTISQYSGFATKYLNTGKISKQGLEITLNLKLLNMSNLTWDLNAVFSWLIKNEVVSIAEGIDRFVAHSVWKGETAPSMVHSVGHPWGEIYAQGIKMYNGKPELNADSSYITEPMINFGSVLPKFTGGIQNSIRFLRNFTIVANFDYQVGGKYFSSSEIDATYNGELAWTAGLNDKGNPVRDPIASGGGVHVSGVDASTHKDVDYYIDAHKYFQSFTKQNIFDPFINDLSYIKLRELSAGYDIPVSETASLKKYIRGARISLVATNVWLIRAKKYDFDPSEISFVSGEIAQFPSTRSIGINIKINF